jgi:putative FmdB family regulatory protein
VPTYQYRCTSCGESLEAVQRFADDPLTVCPTCNGHLRKLFSPVGVVFKGSGFYTTDSRSSSKRSPSADGGGSKTAETKPSSDTAEKGTDKGSGMASKSKEGKAPEKVA